jgi:hypothetical protein
LFFVSRSWEARPNRSLGSDVPCFWFFLVFFFFFSFCQVGPWCPGLQVHEGLDQDYPSAGPFEGVRFSSHRHIASLLDRGLRVVTSYS